MSQQLSTTIAVIGIDIGKNSFHVVGLDQCGAIVLRQKWSRGQVESRFANMPPCLIGMEACVGFPGTLISRSQPTSRWAMASISPDKASITGLVVFAASIVGLWLCSPGKVGKMKPLLRGGLDTWAGLAITVGFGIGIAMMIAGAVG